RFGDHRGCSAWRSWHLEGGAEERRGLRGQEGQGIERGRGLLSTIEQTQPITEIVQDYRKRLMVFGGRASMELAARIGGHLGVAPGDVTLKTFSNGEVYCRY